MTKTKAGSDSGLFSWVAIPERREAIQIHSVDIA